MSSKTCKKKIVLNLSLYEYLLSYISVDERDNKIKKEIYVYHSALIIKPKG